MKILIQQPALPRYRIPLFQEWARRSGVEITLFYSSKNKALGNVNPIGFAGKYVPMHQFRIGSRRLMWHSAQWWGAARNTCDVLVLSWDVQYLSLVPALLRARKNGVKTILWGHGYSKSESVVRKKIRDGVGHLADALVFYDQETARKFLDAGWPKDKIHAAPNALDQDSIQAARERWLKAPDRLATFMKEHGLEGRHNLIYIGRIYQENRLDILIEALPLIVHRHPRVQLVIIGEGGSYEASLRRLAETLNVESAIKWVGAIYDEEKIAPYMLASCLFCYPANIGLSIMHAMGYGLPVVTGDYIPGHNPEIHALRDGENGRLFRHLDAEDLARQISSLLDHPEKMARMGTNARQGMLDTYTIPRMVDGFMGAIKSLVGSA